MTTQDTSEEDPLASTPWAATQLLARGGMGAVYAARHRVLGHEVVVKLLHGELAEHEGVLDRMRVEAQAQAKLAGAHILGCIDFGLTEDEVPYLVAPRLHGQTLFERLREDVPLARREALSIVRQLLLALTVAHTAGVVHRDIKPSNLFLCADGPIQPFLKLIDFGVAKILGGSGIEPAARTRTGAFVGTPRWASPEQVAGKPVDARSDLYAAGLIAYRLLCGVGPYDAIKAQGDLMMAQAFMPPPPPSEHAPWMPAKLEAVLLLALEKDPAKRFQSAEEFLAALPLPESDMTEPFPRAAADSRNEADDATTTTPFPPPASEPEPAVPVEPRARSRSAADDPTQVGVGLDDDAPSRPAGST